MEHKEEAASEQGYNHEQKKRKGFDGLHVGKKDLWMLAGGALGALAFLGLSKASQKVRPAAVGVVKEGYAFKEWVAGKAEKLKEDVEDIVAEGVHQYQEDLSASADAVQREKTILEKIEKVVEEKLARMKTAKGEEAV